MRPFFAIFVLFLLPQAQATDAVRCPNWMQDRSGLKACPNGSNLLPENYPTAAVVIGDNRRKANDRGEPTADAHERPAVPY